MNIYKTVCERHYTGDLDENDIANGQGTMKYSGGAKYIGEFKSDKRHGQGINILPMVASTHLNLFINHWNNNTCVIIYIS